MLLYGNQVSSIGANTFSGLGNLDYLDLSSNQITSIDAGAFNGLGSLTGLVLYGNQIAVIEAGAFGELVNLDYLDLSGQQLTSIASGTFSGLASLTDLNLCNNQIASIAPGAFQGLDNLQYLNLSGNQISHIEAGAFSGLSSLETLDLSYSQITSIQAGAFSELRNLEVLYLWDNISLTNLNLEGADFSSLTTLEVFGTSITSVSLKNAVLNQTSLDALMDGFSSAGIFIAELDLRGVNFAGIADLSMMYGQDYLEKLLLAGATNLDGSQVVPLTYELDSLVWLDVAGLWEGFDIGTQNALNLWDAIGGNTLVTGSIAGDANRDGKVDADDAAVLAANWLTAAAATWEMGDFNDDGRVDDLDASLLAVNWQHGLETSASVPEPSSVILLAIGVILVLSSYRFIFALEPTSPRTDR